MSRDVDPTSSILVFGKPLVELTTHPVDLKIHATPCRFRLLDCNAFLDSQQLCVYEFPNVSFRDLPYAAVSYPWRDLQMAKNITPPEGSFSVMGAEHADEISIDVLRTACLAARQFGGSFLWVDRLCIMQESKDDKNWQIQRMFQIYRNCDPCLVLPGGLVRLAGLSEPTTWIDRAWTLQEAAANLTRDTVKCVFSFTQTSYSEFVRELPDPGYTTEFLDYLYRSKGFATYIIEPGRSATCDILDLFSKISHDVSFFSVHDPVLSKDYNNYPIRMISPPAAALLSKSLVYNNAINYQFFWMSAFVRSSSRPVDMIFSIMGPMGVNLTVSQFHKEDRAKATIKLIQALIHRGRRAEWLYIAPEMPPSSEISTLPAFPETSESGRAVIYTPNGPVPAFEAVGLPEPWRADRAPKGIMFDSGYFKFSAKAALVVGKSYGAAGSGSNPIALERAMTRAHDDGETWAIVIGSRKEFNRNPKTGRISPFLAEQPHPVIVELTLMFVENHGYELFHRLGMEHEVDEKKTSGWDWTYREFSVGGPGRGVRARFTTSVDGPVYA